MSVKKNSATGLKIKLNHLVMRTIHLLSIDNINKRLIKRELFDWRHVESVDIIPEMNFILLITKFVDLFQIKLKHLVLHIFDSSHVHRALVWE